MECLDPDLQNIDSDNEFKGTILPYIKIKANSTLSMHDMYGVKLPSRFRLNFSHLKEQKICHGFKDGTNCMCDCGSATDATLHFLLQCQQYQTSRLELLNSIYNLDPKIRNLSNDKCLHLLLYGSKSYSFEINREIIKLTIKFLKSSRPFERSLLWPVFPLLPHYLRGNDINFS